MDSHTIQQSSGLRTHFNAAAAISIYLCSLVSLWHRQRQKKMIKIHAFAGSVINPLFTSSFFSFCCCWRWRAWKEFTHVQTSCNIHCGDVHKKLRAKKKSVSISSRPPLHLAKSVLPACLPLSPQHTLLFILFFFRNIRIYYTIRE